MKTSKIITPRQELKLKTIKSGSSVFNHYMNPLDQLVIETTYGTSYFQRIFIGPRGGFCGRWVYKHYDHNDKTPFTLLFKQY
jgi:hypothetical protein